MPFLSTTPTVRVLARASATVALVLPAGLRAQQAGGGQADLAQKLANPVAALVSLPFQVNYDRGIGPAEDGTRLTVNVQPVVPFRLNADWNLISRTILPVVSQSDIAPGLGRQSGIGDVVQSAFLSPAKPTASGWIWGAGPVLLVPTASDRLLGGGKWGVGPTAVALRQRGPWTYGGLVNHLVSIAGQSARGDVNVTFANPFVSYVTPSATTYTLLSEASRDWERRGSTVMLGAGVSQVLTAGTQLLSVGGSLRYWVASPDGVGPRGLGVRAVIVLLFPR